MEEGLTFHPVDDYQPVWSPNGGRIAFDSNRTGTFDIWTMKHEGSEMIQITSDTTRDSAPYWGKTGFSENLTDDTMVTGQGKENIVYIGTVHLAEGGAASK